MREQQGPSRDPWAAAFSLAGHTHRYFFHPHNCGFPGRRRTERTVELALADTWLAASDGMILEIGAVTPYYWPGRVATVVDPADPHERVQVRASLFDVNLTGFDVLSISTVEHIGEHAYGLAEAHSAHEAIEKIAREARTFLLTFAVGWNASLDALAFAGGLDHLCAVRFLVRNDDETWQEADAANARRPYGDNAAPWANAVCILERPARPATTERDEARLAP